MSYHNLFLGLTVSPDRSYNLTSVIIDFLHEDKHQSFLQADSIIFTGRSYVCLVIVRYAQGTPNSNFVIPLQYIKKERDEIDFCCMQKNIKLIHYRLIQLILVGMARHLQITQNNKFAKSL